jgi:hypothetical protein
MSPLKWPGWFFSATWETVNPFDKSVFTSFANSGIFGKCFDKSAFSRIANDGIFAKWSDKVLCGTLNLLQYFLVADQKLHHHHKD